MVLSIEPISAESGNLHGGEDLSCVNSEEFRIIAGERKSGSDLVTLSMKNRVVEKFGTIDW
jgi:hypothetical protein